MILSTKFYSNLFSFKININLNFNMYEEIKYTFLSNAGLVHRNILYHEWCKFHYIPQIQHKQPKMDFNIYMVFIHMEQYCFINFTRINRLQQLVSSSYEFVWY